jgi:hypothetical protein
MNAKDEESDKDRVTIAVLRTTSPDPREHYVAAPPAAMMAYVCI